MSDSLAGSVGDPVTDGVRGSRGRLSRRTWMLIVSLGTTSGLLAVALLLPVPFVRISPGPTFNVIGTDDGREVIEIEGTRTYPATGALDMTTVLEAGGPRGGLTFIRALTSWLDPTDAVVPRELLFPDDVTGEEVRQRQAALFSTSSSHAVSAAMDYLGEPVSAAVVVTAVYGDTPAEGLLEVRDEVVAVDGEPVTSTGDVVEAVRSKPIGSELEFTVRRVAMGDTDEGAGTSDTGPSELTVRVTTADNPDAPGTAYIGIGLGPLYTADFPISFTLDDVGGPSAGLMFAMGIIAKLSPVDLTAGQHVAGTGTITPDGKVGRIGGIRQKLAGAREAGASLFLMPADHCAEAAGHVPDGLTVTPVATLSEAVAAVEGFVAGREIPACPVETT